MEIKKALEATGKAVGYTIGSYVALDEDGILYWYTCASNEKGEPVSLFSINKQNWQPYSLKEEIRPENAGELWESPSRTLFITKVYDDDLYFTTVSACNKDHSVYRKVYSSHTNEWKRIHPPVEDDS